MVNILPSDKPSDIYQLVTDKTLAELKALAVRLEPEAQVTQEDEGPTEAELAQWWLEFGISRTTTKRSTRYPAL